MAQFKSLTPEQLESWRRDGFLLVRAEDAWTAPESVKHLVEWTDDLGTWKETPGKWMMYFSESLKDKSRLLHRIENFFPYHEGFNTTFNSPSFISVLSQLFDE